MPSLLTCGPAGTPARPERGGHRVDTDVASKLIKRQEPEWVRRALVGNRVWLTFVTVGEVSKWAEGSQLGSAAPNPR